MTISSTTNREAYSGNGSTTVFSFPYYFLANADLKVYLRDETLGTETLQVITTNYTVTGAGVLAGGSVTMLVAPPTGYSLVIYRDTAPTQGLDLRENDSLPAEEVEKALDRLTMVTQRLADRVGRVIGLTDAFTDTFDASLPALIEADRALIINSTADGFSLGPTADEIEGAAAEAAAAAASAAAAATAETNAELAETNAEASEVAAAASAASAASQLASAFFRDVVYKTNADSPITIGTSDNGKLFSLDSSGGAITINLPQVSAVTLPFNVAFKLKTSGNPVTINRAGTDVIDGATTKTMTLASEGTLLVADDTPALDEWTSFSFTPSAAAPTPTIRYTLSGAVVPYVCIDGAYRAKQINTVSSVDISMLNSGTSGSTQVRVNQYRAGALFDSETASLAASSGNPVSSNVALSGSLVLAANDLLTVDVVSKAGGAPSELSVELIFT